MDFLFQKNVHNDEQGRLLYQIIDPMVANEPVRERPAGN